MNSSTLLGRKEPYRIALIDFYADGHHAPYLQNLASGLEEVGARVTVFGPYALRELTEVDHFVPLAGCERLNHLKGIHRQWAALPLCRQAIIKAMIRQSTHIHFLYADWHISAIAAAWRLSRPTAGLLLTVHWSLGVGVGGIGIKDQLRRLPHRRALSWLTARQNARVLVHHQAIAKDLVSVVSAGQIGVIPYPTQLLPVVTMESQADFKQTLGLNRQDKLILCYGDTRFDKGADLAIRVLAGLPGRFHLLIAGRPHHFHPDELRQRAALSDVENRVHLIPRFMSDQESALVFHTCDIVLLPYRREFSGQSGPLTQASAIGKPVVVADLPVLANTVRTFHLGIVSPPEDIGSMVGAVQAAEKWHPESQDTTTFVEHHSPQAFVRTVYKNYLEIR